MSLITPRAAATALLALLLPTRLARPLLRLLGHRIAPSARIGLSWVSADFIGMGPGTRIGHFNAIAVRRLILRDQAYVGRANLIGGPLDVVLRPKAAIGNGNRIQRAPLGLVSGRARLWLGELTKITSRHHLDCTMSVSIGAHSIIAGAGTQLWTHGYVHEVEGPGRYRIDGRIILGHNVYLGSACIVTAGVRIADGVMVGAGATVARHITKMGTYVAASLRQLERPADPRSRPDLRRLEDAKLREPVYVKRELH